VWSYNSGECLKRLDKGNTKEVTKTAFVSVNQSKYIVAVGWDKQVTIFNDVADTIQEVYKPLNVWSTTSECVHKTDILAVAYGSPHLLATASFCGKIVVWSLISYRILSEMKAEYPASSDPPSPQEGDEAVQDLVFLDQRTKSKESACLIASGPAGYIHFWNIYNISKPMACFSASNYNCVTSLAVDSKNILLLTGDIEGFLSLWRIESYCTSRSTSFPPERATVWRAHTQKITQLLLVEQWNVLISASADTSVRVWTLDGHSIGTFGQEKTWSLGVPLSYQHPLKSKDLLLHASIPPSHDTKQSEELATVGEASKLKSPPRHPPAVNVRPALTVTEIEEEIEDDLLQPYGIHLEVSRNCIQDGVQLGKWLRHHRIQSAKHGKTVASPQKVYRLLPYQTMDSEPDFQRVEKESYVT
jgi:hypothetical protein